MRKKFAIFLAVYYCQTNEKNFVVLKIYSNKKKHTNFEFYYFI